MQTPLEPAWWLVAQRAAQPELQLAVNYDVLGCCNRAFLFCSGAAEGPRRGCSFSRLLCLQAKVVFDILHFSWRMLSATSAQRSDRLPGAAGPGRAGQPLLLCRAFCRDEFRQPCGELRSQLLSGAGRPGALIQRHKAENEPRKDPGEDN